MPSFREAPTVSELKAGFVGCMRQHFPERRVSVTLYSPNSKHQADFAHLARVLHAHHIDPRRYLPFVFAVSERPPTVRGLRSTLWITRFLHDQGG